MINEIKQPDLNAPRFRPTRLCLLTPEFFKKFRKKYPQYIDVDDKKLRDIIGLHNETIWKEVIENRDGVEFPENLGFLFVGTCNPPKKHNTDYATSIQYKQRLRHRNFESDNYVAKIFYTNYAGKYKFRHRELWQFKGIREFTRGVSEAYPENWKKYVQVENFEKINKLFKRLKSRRYYVNKTAHDILDYNEFDMN